MWRMQFKRFYTSFDFYSVPPDVADSAQLYCFYYTEVYKQVQEEVAQGYNRSCRFVNTAVTMNTWKSQAWLTLIFSMK